MEKYNQPVDDNFRKFIACMEVISMQNGDEVGLFQLLSFVIRTFPSDEVILFNNYYKEFEKQMSHEIDIFTFTGYAKEWAENNLPSEMFQELDNIIQNLKE